MQTRKLNSEEIVKLAKRFAQIRLHGKANVSNVDLSTLTIVHRDTDANDDLFTIANVLQENVIRFPVSYDINTTDKDGNSKV